MFFSLDKTELLAQVFSELLSLIHDSLNLLKFLGSEFFS